MSDEEFRDGLILALSVEALALIVPACMAIWNEALISEAVINAATLTALVIMLRRAA